MNSVSNTTTHNYIHVSLSMINKTKLLLICILSSPRYFYKLICWFIILINSYRHSRISVDSIPELDLFTSPESSTSASTESDLGEDIESFVWRGLTFPVHWVYHIIMQIKALVSVYVLRIYYYLLNVVWIVLHFLIPKTLRWLFCMMVKLHNDCFSTFLLPCITHNIP